MSLRSHYEQFYCGVDMEPRRRSRGAAGSLRLRLAMGGAAQLARRSATAFFGSSSNSSASLSIMVPPSCSASTMVTARR